MGIRFAACLIGLAIWASGARDAAAAPRITESTAYYSVAATSARDLRQEMRRKGPRGFWAYTNWEVRWSGRCDVSVRVLYTLPRHANPGALSPRLRRSFDRMLERLEAHERLHGLNGINAAREIKDGDCRDAQRIIRKYNRADRALDRRTDHGRKDGVVLE